MALARVRFQNAIGPPDCDCFLSSALSCLMKLLPIRSRRTDNCFIRLHPQTARALCVEGIQKHGSSKVRHAIEKDSANWSIARLDGSLDVEFLPLRLEYCDGRVVFASYNGGSIEDPDRLEIPHNLDPDYPLDESSSLSVEIVPYCPVAKELSFMPKTVEDYSGLQLEAEHLEYGGLLQQISIVGSQQQDVNVSIASGTVQLRVVEQKGNDGWPSPECWRLMNETEIIVQPPASAAAEKTPTLRRIPCLQDMIDNIEMKHLAAELFGDGGKRWVNLPPKTVAVHPSTGMEMCIAILRREGGRAFVRVVTNVEVPAGAVAIHPLLVRQMDYTMHPFDSVFTLEALSDEVVQETASQFLESVRENGLSFRQVKWTPNQELPLWNTPGISMYPYIKPPPFDCHEILKSIDKETPICLNDLFSASVGGLMDSRTIGQVVTDVDECLFGFTGDLLELYSIDRNTLKQQCSKQTTCLSSTIPGLRTLVPRASVFRQELLSFAKSLGPQRGCVVCGQMGTGKTHSALLLAAAKKLQHDSETFYLDCRALKHSVDMRMKTILEQISRLGEDGNSSKKPTTFIIDNIDAFVPGNGSQADIQDSAQTVDVDDVEIDQSKLIFDVLATRISSLNERGSLGSFTVVTCENVGNLDQFLKYCGIWGTVYDISPLNALERRLLFRSAMLRSYTACPHQFGVGFDKLCVGFRCRDFDKLAARLGGTCDSPAPHTVEEELKRFVPICRIGIQLKSSDKSFILDTLGALFEPKRCLDETVIRPSRYRRIYAAAKVGLPRGVLLYGYPGTGKTALVTALANECGYSLVTCSGPELLDKYIGASETKVRELFYRAASAAPSILFFDEFDALAPRRGSDNSGVTDRIVNQLLTFLDGVNDLSRKSHGTVFIVAASSRPDKIDPALLRPGRFERHIFCGLVDESTDRHDLLLKISSKYPLDSALAAAISTGELLETVALPRKGLSSADVDGIFSAAYTRAIDDMIGCTESGSDLPVHVKIQISHFRRACAEATISIPPKELDHLQSIYSRFSGKESTKPHRQNEQSQRVALR